MEVKNLRIFSSEIQKIYNFLSICNLNWTPCIRKLKLIKFMGKDWNTLWWTYFQCLWQTLWSELENSLLCSTQFRRPKCLHPAGPNWPHGWYSQSLDPFQAIGYGPSQHRCPRQQCRYWGTGSSTGKDELPCQLSNEGSHRCQLLDAKSDPHETSEIGLQSNIFIKTNQNRVLRSQC